MDYTPPVWAWPYVILAALLLLLFLVRRGDWPVLLLAVALHDPHLVALWDGPGKATVTWQATERTCLYYQGALVSCYNPGKYILTFGHTGPLDAAYRPALGGVYTLVGESDVWRAEVKKRAVYLPVFYL